MLSTTDDAIREIERRLKQIEDVIGDVLVLLDDAETAARSRSYSDPATPQHRHNLFGGGGENALNYIRARWATISPHYDFDAEGIGPACPTCLGDGYVGWTNVNMQAPEPPERIACPTCRTTATGRAR